MADTNVQIDIQIKEALKDELLELLGGTPQEAVVTFRDASLAAVRAYWKSRLKHHREQVVVDDDPIA